MKITEDIYLNTDKIIKGNKYNLVYNGKIFKEDISNKMPEYDVILVIGKKEIAMQRKDYGYIAECVFENYNNEISIIKKDKVDKRDKDEKKDIAKYNYNLNAIEKPDILKENEITGYIISKKEIESIPQKISNAISKAFKFIPKLFENRMDLNKIKNQ